MRVAQLIVATALCPAWCLSIPAASAQGPSAQGQSRAPQTQAPSQQRPPAAAPDVSDKKLDAAAAAMQRVASLQQDYRERVAAAQAPADKQRIVEEANQALTKAVTDQGLSVEEYSSILETARDNLDVRDKIIQRLQPAGQPPHGADAPPNK